MTSNPDLEQYRIDLRHNALYQAELSALYHRKRERFLALCDRAGKALALVAGTAAFSSILGTAEAKSYAGLVVGIATLPGLIFAWADKARLHSELAQKYITLQSEIISVGERDFTEEQCFSWQARLRSIEVNEPPTLTILVRICQNQIAMAAGQSDAAYKISSTERFFAQIFDMQSSKLERI